MNRQDNPPRWANTSKMFRIRGSITIRDRITRAAGAIHADEDSFEESYTPRLRDDDRAGAGFRVPLYLSRPGEGRKRRHDPGEAHPHRRAQRHKAFSRLRLLPGRRSHGARARRAGADRLSRRLDTGASLRQAEGEPGGRRAADAIQGGGCRASVHPAGALQPLLRRSGAHRLGRRDQCHTEHLHRKLPLRRGGLRDVALQRRGGPEGPGRGGAHLRASQEGHPQRLRLRCHRYHRRPGIQGLQFRLGVRQRGKGRGRHPGRRAPAVRWPSATTAPPTAGRRNPPATPGAPPWNTPR